MSKTPVRRKRRCIIAIILIAAVLFAAGAFITLSSTAKSLYWSSHHLQYALLPLEEYDEITIENDAQLAKAEAIVHVCNEGAVPLGEGQASAFLESCNGALIRFFNDTYGVDIAEKLDALTVMRVYYLNDISEMVGGSYSDDFPDKLFLNGTVLDSFEAELAGVQSPELARQEFSAKILRNIYIHEVMHYLGFNSDSVFNHFTEALAESLSKKVILYSGIKYEDITGYRDIQGFAAQIVECDPQLVIKVLTDSGFDLGQYFNNRLDGEYGINYAEYYDKLIGLVRQNNSKDAGRLKYYAQYLTYEYCKAVDPHAEKTLKDLGEDTVSFFELRWVFADKNDGTTPERPW